MKRIKTERASEILGVTQETVRNYAKAKYITRLPSPTRDWFFDEAEVEAFARGGVAGAEAYRLLNQDHPVAPKRGRKVGAR